MPNPDLRWPKATFLLTLDTELAWGMRGEEAYLDDFKATREVIHRLLDLFDRYDLPVTWATVGHLFLDHCAPVDGVLHPEIKTKDEEHFFIDPARQMQTNDIWYGSDILKAIQSAKTKHEIGCHTFSHPYMWHPQMDEAWFVSELEACQSIAKKQGIELHSFVFPRNDIRFAETLSKHGFTSFRGVDPTWYRWLPKPLRKIAHAVDQRCALTPPTVKPRFDQGLVNIPGSQFFLHRKGWGQQIPLEARVKKAKKGIAKAIAKQEIFHLWFHPFNLASDQEGLFEALEQILKRVAEERKNGRLQTTTMTPLANVFRTKYG